MNRQEALRILEDSAPGAARKLGALRGGGFEIGFDRDALSRQESGRRVRFKPGVLGQPELDQLLRELHRLHPLRELWCDAGLVTIIPEDPIPWPLFVRLDLAKPFSGLAEAPCLAARSVASVSLGRKLMEATIC